MRRPLLILTLSLLPTLATGAEPRLTKEPALLEFIDATYPPEAEAQKITGSVGLLIVIEETGAVGEVVVSEPAGHGFDEAAVEAVKRFRFSPAEIDGEPAAVQIAFRYNFVLRPQESEAPREAPVNFRGKLVTRGDRDPIAAATVHVGDTLSAQSDAEGRFEIRGVPPGTQAVVVEAPGHNRYETTETFVEGEAVEVTYYVRKRLGSEYETVVQSKRERKEVAKVELKQEEIRLIPGTQGDAFKVVQNLPSVARVPYGMGMLVVRGGRPMDSRVYVDGVYVPILFHFGGLVSTFNSELLHDLSFSPGNFGARLGRSTGGTLEATSRSPTEKGVHGYANINMLDTSALVESPIGEGWGLAVAGRVSYVDLILSQFLPDSVRFLQAPRYMDYQLKVERARPGDRDKFRFMAFGSHDQMKVLYSDSNDLEGRDTVALKLGYQRLMGSWERALSDTAKNKLTLALGLDYTNNSFGEDIGGMADAWSLQLRDATNWKLLDNLDLEVGVDAYLGRVLTDVTAPQFSPNEIPDPILSRSLTTTRWDWTLVQPGLYAETSWKPFQGTKLVPGVRFDYEGTLRRMNVDPRLSVFQALDQEEMTVLKGGVGLYSQPPDFTMGQWTPEFGNPDLRLERSLHTMVGVERKFTEAISLDLQLYYKSIFDQVRNSNREVVRDGERVQERFANVGEGRAYGAEILLRHSLTDRLFGWISYGLSRSEWHNPLAKDPGWTRFPFDQPHHLVAVASYKWTPEWTTGVRVQYISGSPRTPVQGAVYDADSDRYQPIWGVANSARMPDFFSVDLRVDRSFVFQDWALGLFVDVQNVTNNTNPEAMIYNYDYTKSAYLSGLPILPSLGVKGEF